MDMASSQKASWRVWSLRRVANIRPSPKRVTDTGLTILVYFEPRMIITILHLVFFIQLCRSLIWNPCNRLFRASLSPPPKPSELLPGRFLISKNLNTIFAWIKSPVTIQAICICSKSYKIQGQNHILKSDNTKGINKAPLFDQQHKRNNTVTRS